MKLPRHFDIISKLVHGVFYNYIQKEGKEVEKTLYYFSKGCAHCEVVLDWLNKNSQYGRNLRQIDLSAKMSISDRSFYMAQMHSVGLMETPALVVLNGDAALAEHCVQGDEKVIQKLQELSEFSVV